MTARTVEALRALLFTADDSPSYDACIAEARAALAEAEKAAGAVASDEQREHIEAVIACLEDDAPTIRADSGVDDDERAANMEEAARLLRAALAAPHPEARDDGMPTSDAERQLRRLLAVRVGMPGAYYDDGEAQGDEHGVFIDFMRDPVADLDAKLRALNVARAIVAEKAREAQAVAVPQEHPTREELEVAAIKAERRAVMFGDILHNHILAMRAACVAAKLEGLDVGMRWIANTLEGPGHLPDLDEARALGGAQALFDKEMAEHEAFRAAHPAPGAAAPAAPQPKDDTSGSGR